MNNPFSESPYDDAEALDACESPLIRRPVDNSLYARLKRGETVHVMAERTGLRFSVVPEHHETGLWAYSVRLEDGSISPGHNRVILDNATVRDWCSHLKEIEEE
jgi:hypothetical protein